MQREYEYIDVQREDGVFCVRLRDAHVEDQFLEDLCAELARLIDEENCRKMVLNLGPDEPDCLFSIFLAKLINLNRRLELAGGTLALAHVSDDVRGMFRAAGIEKFFHFYDDQATAVQALHSHS